GKCLDEFVNEPVLGFAGQFFDVDAGFGGDPLQQGAPHLSLVGLDEVEVAGRYPDGARKGGLRQCKGFPACAYPEADRCAHLCPVNTLTTYLVLMSNNLQN